MAARRWILAIDQGNGGAKAAAVDPDGAILGTGEAPVSVSIGPDGAATQDAGEWAAALRGAVHGAVAAARVDRQGLAAVGITGQWGSTVPVGADGEPVGPVLLWADTRAAPHARRIIGGRPSVSGVSLLKAVPWLRVTGGAPNPSGADPTGHSALLGEELADVGRRCRVLLEPVDYIGLRLTGRAAATPASMILSWVTDNRVGARPGYVPELVRRARRDPALLPELLPTGSVLGQVQPAAAVDFGLRAGAPVICGIPDLHAAVIGSGAVAPFQTHLAVSTTAWLSARVPFKRTDPLHSIATLPGLDPLHPVVGNNIETGGAALRWLRDQIIAPHDGLRARPSYDDLFALAGAAPAGSEGVIFTPWLNGERSPREDRHLRGAWLNLSLRTDRALLVRSVLEGVALNIRWLFEHYERFLRRQVPEVRILGGGARSDLWCQIIADTLGRPVLRVADPLHAHLRGVALWARVCLGEISVEHATARVGVERTFAPQAPARDIYERHYRQYRTLARRLSGVYRRMGVAAGPGAPTGR